MSSKISDVTPRFCTVHVISKGKLLNVRKSDIDIETSITDDRSENQFTSSSHSGNNYFFRTQEVLESRFDFGCFCNILGSVSSTSSHQFSSTPLLFQRMQALSTVNQKVGTKIGTNNNIDTHHNRTASLDVDTKMLNQKGFYRTNSSGIGYGGSDIQGRRRSYTDEGSSSSCSSDPTSSSSQV